MRTEPADEKREVSLLELRRSLALPSVRVFCWASRFRFRLRVRSRLAGGGTEKTSFTVTSKISRRLFDGCFRPPRCGDADDRFAILSLPPVSFFIFLFFFIFFFFPFAPSLFGRYVTPSRRKG